MTEGKKDRMSEPRRANDPTTDRKELASASPAPHSPVSVAKSDSRLEAKTIRILDL